MEKGLTYRPLEPGMGEAVAARTILRTTDGRQETWGEVADRVAFGNTSLAWDKHEPDEVMEEYRRLRDHIAFGRVLMSGRHLQHGDALQPQRNLEIFSNCSTAAASFIKFYLLLNGSGVGRSYDDALMVVDWDYLPQVVCVLSEEHPDYRGQMTPEEARERYPSAYWFEVPDSREGWAKAVELMERMAFERAYANEVLVLDFSKVRPKGSPIGGMQNRPASGPIPLMEAIEQIHAVKGKGYEPWEQAMRIDHALAACVAVGGARRAARIAIKDWRDPGIFKFIDIKQQGGLWSANNSIGVDAEFWKGVEAVYQAKEQQRHVPLTKEELWAYDVFCAATKAQFEHGTGEPGFINLDRLNTNEEGLERYADGEFTYGFKYRVDPVTERGLLKKVYEGLLQSRYKFIVNPCVTADTWVQTSEGPQQVSDLIGKPFTAVVDGKEYAATGFWQTGVKEVLRVRTDRGYELRLTANHKLLVERQKYGGGYNRDLVWVEAGDLNPGDKLVLQNHRGYEWDGEGTEEEGWLLGEIVGDNPEKFWGPSREVMKDEAVAALSLRYITEGEKRLLPAVERTSAAFHRGFLRGLFDVDGSVQGSVSHGHSVRLAQSGAVGLERLQVVQRMLLRLGIASTIYENRKEAGMPDGKGTEAVHELVISRDNIHQFAREVGFTEPSKQEALRALVSEPTRGPYAESFTAKVVEVVSDGEESVYDCTVAEVHRFDANGITAHNCGEIVLFAGGAYCVIADVVPFFADDLDQARDAFLAATRALIRTNLMKSLYQKEVERTNRIGVGMTGIHEFAWKFFRLTFRDLIADFDYLMELSESALERIARTPMLRTKTRMAHPSFEFWLWLWEMRNAVEAEADRYSDALGVSRPHTVTTSKPAGCRPWNALTTTTHGLLTLQELFEDHEDGAVWSDIKRPIAAIQDGQTRRLVRTFDNGEAEVLRVQLSYGLTVESTANHPWYVKRRYLGNARYQEVGEWVPAGELKPGDVLDVNVGVYQNTNHAPLRRVPMFAVRMRGNGNSIRQPETMNPDLAWLLGYLWGDGAMSPEKYRLRWMDRNVENLRKANRILREQFGISGTLREDPNKDAHSLEVGNKELWHWLIKNGFYKYYEDEIDLIPRAVRASARDDIIAFIAGLVDADGAIGRTNSDYTVILAQQHERFSRHVQDVGWAVGLAFGMSHNTVGENWQPARKSMYLMTLSAASDPDAVRVLARHSTKMSAAEKESGFVRWRANHPGRAIRRVIGKVESVESIGVMPTYDVEVEDNHWFYAGAVKSHNTTSKLFLLTEGAHLPAQTEFLRWVQFQKGDPLIEEYEAKGYPTMEVEQYPDVVLVGFPTQPMICRLGIPRDRLVTASEATMEEQYKWVRLLEKFWLGPRGNQISYTLKYDREAMSLEDYRRIILTNQPHVRAISVLPSSDWRRSKEIYGYVPEEPISLEEFRALESRINTKARETIALEDLQCASGACPL